MHRADVVARHWELLSFGLDGLRLSAAFPVALPSLEVAGACHLHRADVAALSWHLLYLILAAGRSRQMADVLDKKHPCRVPRLIGAGDVELILVLAIIPFSVHLADDACRHKIAGGR